MRARSGIALIAALLATILVAALLAALFFAVTEETRTGAAIETRDRALATCESAVEAGLVRLRASVADAFAVGAVETYSVGGQGTASVVHITRLDSSLYWIVAVAGDTGDPAIELRRIGVLAVASRLPPDSTAIVRRAERAWSDLF